MFHSRIAALFERLPMLCGFAVSEDLEVVQVALHTWPGWVPGGELAAEIREALEGLIIEGRDEAARQLRGRTFARTIH